MKNINITIIILLFFLEILNAQNLIKNNGFEARHLPYTYATNWSSVENWGKGKVSGTPDYHHLEAGTGVNLSAIDTSAGCVGSACGTPFEGSAILGLYTSLSITEWIQGELIDTLIPGECYRVSYAIRSSNTSAFANNWGLLFSVDSLSYEPYPFPPFHPLYNSIDAANWPLTHGTPFNPNTIDYSNKQVNEFVSDTNITSNTNWEVKTYIMVAGGPYKYVYPSRHGLPGSTQSNGIGGGLGAYVWMDSLFIEKIEYSIDNINDVTSCNKYILPAITGNNLFGSEAYYTGLNGTGTKYNAGDTISNTMQLYLYGSIPGGSCFSEIPFIVNIENIFIDAGNDTTICAGNEILFSAISSPNSTLTWSNGIVNDEIVELTESNTFYVTAVSNSCTISDSIFVNVLELPAIDLGDDFAIFEGETIELKANQAVYYLWSTSDTSQNIIVSPDKTTTYSVTIQNENDCKNSDDITITVNKKIDNTPLLIPNAFSPNNDGLNDYFRIYNQELFNLISLKIYNRWGDLVFSSLVDNKKMWDGNYKNEPQPIGQYTYFIKVIKNNDDKVISVSNTINLIR